VVALGDEDEDGAYDVDEKRREQDDQQPTDQPAVVRLPGASAAGRRTTAG